MATVRIFRTVRQEGGRKVEREIAYYNLDMIISLGYRVKSLIATQFLRWETARLKEYIACHNPKLGLYVNHAYYRYFHLKGVLGKSSPCGC